MKDQKRKIKEHIEVVKSWRYYRYLFWCSILFIMFLFSAGSILAYNKIFVPKVSTEEQKDDLKKQEELSIEPIAQESQTPTPTDVIDSQTNANSNPTIAKNSSVSSTTTPSEPIKPSACFNYSSSDVFGADVYYFGRPIVLDAGCTQDAKEYLWYFNDKLLSGLGQKMTTSFKAWTRVNESDVVEGRIKLIVNGNNGLTNSTERVIKLKTVPRTEICFTPTGAQKHNIAFNENVVFSMSCTKENSENPVTKYYWEFRDGTSDNPIRLEGKEVSHAFTKFANSFSGGNSGDDFYKGFSVSAGIELKMGGGGNATDFYFPKQSDPVVLNLLNYMRNNHKDIDQAIVDLNL